MSSQDRRLIATGLVLAALIASLALGAPARVLELLAGSIATILTEGEGTP